MIKVREDISTATGGSTFTDLCCAKEYYSIISAAPFNLQEVNNQFEILN
jgi:hypothetical protein